MKLESGEQVFIEPIQSFYVYLGEYLGTKATVLEYFPAQGAYSIELHDGGIIMCPEEVLVQLQ